ncbi:MAG: CDP-glucose 4,6-dehydratase [Candidatus Saganbacteria bacterium]|nr:CDP-glucose 4,6-dehydratase [Candidatus Saganbacteria bacterium]
MEFWRKKRVFITGHTGFKGSWLCLWLSLLGAKVTGYALRPPTNPSLFNLCKVDELVSSVIADVRDSKSLKKAMSAAKPEIVIHMAAQPIVRESYKVPSETFAVNVMGTVNVLEAARAGKSVRAVVNVTTDKVYEIRSGVRGMRDAGFKETDALGGHDPYSSSKACSELVAQAYRRSYGMNVATARAGNVIGGGDWAVDRLVPDFVRAVLKGERIKIRNPKATRPWQYVLEPLMGYLILAEKLYRSGDKYAGAWNFGPDDSDARSVEWLVKELCRVWGGEAAYIIECGQQPHETACLRLDNSKAKKQLKWRPKYRLGEALAKVIEWTRPYQRGEDVRKKCWQQIEEYMK